MKSNKSPCGAATGSTQGGVLFGNRKLLKCINRKKVTHTAVSFVIWFAWVFSQRVMVVSGLDQPLEFAQGHGIYTGSVMIYEDDLIIGQIDTGAAGKFDHQEAEIFVDEKAWAAIVWNGNFAAGFRCIRVFCVHIAVFSGDGFGKWGFCADICLH